MSISVTNFGEYSVKSIKSFRGNEGMGFNCNLYRKGKKVGFCYDDAGGGGMHPIDWGTPPQGTGEDYEQEWKDWHAWKDAEQKLLDKHLKTLSKVESEHCKEGLTIDEGWFVSDMVSQWELVRDLKKLNKQCKTKTLFRHSKCAYGGYVILNREYSDAVKARLEKEHGEDIEEIGRAHV